MVDKGLQPVCFFLAIFPCVVCVLLVSLRVCKKFERRTYGLDDTLLIIATILNIVLTITSCNYMLASYTGYHFSDIPPGAVDPVKMLKWNFANSVIYNPILALVKVSFLLTLIKLQSPNKWINGCLWVTLGLNACFAVAGPVAGILQCIPVPKYWDPTIPGKCSDPATWIVCSVSFVLATDVLILIMPTWILYDLKMSFSRKFQVIAFLSIGILVTAVGAYRTSVLVKAFVLGGGLSGPPPADPSFDPTYSVDYTLCNIESGLAILATCGPTIKYLLGFIIPALKSDDQPSSHKYLYPNTGGSQGGSAYIKNAKGNDTYTEMEGDIDEVELRDHHERRFTHDDHAITKTVAWHMQTEVDVSHRDSNSTSEQNLRTPRHVL